MSISILNTRRRINLEFASYVEREMREVTVKEIKMVNKNTTGLWKHLEIHHTEIHKQLLGLEGTLGTPVITILNY